MSYRYGVLCFLLFLIVLILGYENYAIWSSPSAMAPRKDMGKKGEAKPESPAPGAGPKETIPREALNAIAEKNVFNPDRKEFSITAAAAAIAKPVARPQITLFGVVIAENNETASIINPGRPLHKGERETKTLKIGDMVGEYKLTKIMSDRIVMEAGEDSFEVLLYDPRAPKKRVEVKTPTKPATITSTAPVASPAGAMPPTPPAVAVPTPSPVQPAPPTPRAATPLPVPRASGSVPEKAYQPPGSTAPSTTPDPGIWRGRRPITPVAPSSPPG